VSEYLARWNGALEWRSWRWWVNWSERWEVAVKLQVTVKIANTSDSAKFMRRWYFADGQGKKIDISICSCDTLSCSTNF
jgi:hypothetical protein